MPRLISTAAPPLAVDDSFPQPKTGPTTIPTTDILANDIVPSSCASPVIEVVDQPSSGSVTLSGGQAVYTPNSFPNPNTVSDAFTYSIDCGNGTPVSMWPGEVGYQLVSKFRLKAESGVHVQPEHARLPHPLPVPSSPMARRGGVEKLCIALDSWAMLGAECMGRQPWVRSELPSCPYQSVIKQISCILYIWKGVVYGCLSQVENPNLSASCTHHYFFTDVHTSAQPESLAEACRSVALPSVLMPATWSCAAVAACCCHLFAPRSCPLLLCISQVRLSNII